MHRPRIGALIFVAAGLIAIGWLLTRGAFFQFSQIEFRGIHSPELQKAIQRELVSSFGRNLTRLSLSEMSTKLAQYPEMKNLVLRKRLPSTLVVEAEERKPWAQFFIEDKLWLLDERCDPIEPTVTPQALPLLSLEVKAERADEFKKIFLPQVCGFIKKANFLSTQTLRGSDIDSIGWREATGVRVRSDRFALDIELGLNNFEARWLRADKALTLLKAQGVDVARIDSSYSSRVVVSLRNSNNELNLNKLVRRKSSEEAPMTVKAR